MHISLLPARASTKETQARKAQNKKEYQSSWTHSKGVVKVTVGQVQEKGHPPKPPTKLDQNLSVFFFQNRKLRVPLCGRSVVAKFLAAHPTPWQQWTVVLMVSRWCSEGEPSLPTIFVKLASESRYSSISPCGGNAQARWLLERLYKLQAYRMIAIFSYFRWHSFPDCQNIPNVSRNISYTHPEATTCKCPSAEQYHLCLVHEWLVACTNTYKYACLRMEEAWLLDE